MTWGAERQHLDLMRSVTKRWTKAEGKGQNETDILLSQKVLGNTLQSELMQCKGGTLGG